MEVIEHTIWLLLTLTLVLLVGSGALRLSTAIGIPDVVLLLIVGIIVGPVLHLVDIATDSVVNQAILLGGAAYILFHGGTDVDVKVISRTWISIALLATLGVLITAAVVGVVAAQVLGISFLAAFLIGAVLAPTDPASLIPIFDQVKIRPKVSQTVISESTFNDATGASLVLVMVPLVLGVGSFSLSASLGAFAAEVLIGVAVGAAIGMGYVFLTAERFKVLYPYASKLSLVAAILAFTMADLAGGSGFMAAFIAGLVLGNAGYLHLSQHHSVHVRLHSFMNDNTAILRIFIFILLGSHVDFGLVAKYLWPSLAIVAVLMFVARPLTVLICLLPDRIAKWEWKEMLFFVWTREAGVIPAALAGMLIAMEVPGADVISAVVFVAVLVTITLQASTTKFLARKLGLLEDGDQTQGQEDPKVAAPA